MKEQQYGPTANVRLLDAIKDSMRKQIASPFERRSSNELSSDQSVLLCSFSRNAVMRKQMRHVQVKTVQEFLVIPKTEAARLLLYSEKRLAFCLSYSIG